MLARVEQKMAGEPVVIISVHSPKFPNEEDESMVREAVRRFRVTHPVLVDSGHRVWQEYSVRAWPTLVLVDPQGWVVGAASGEPDAEPLENVLFDLLKDARSSGIALKSTPLPVEPEPLPAGSLAYPGKVVAAGGQVFVADTGHDQVVEIRDEGGSGREVRRFGDGTPGLLDGPARTARFSHPNGLALDPGSETLWVADTNNHAIRRIDLGSGEVTTVAGTGEKGQHLLSGQARRVALRSPWDLSWDEVRWRLHIAMAGSHQIFSLDPATGVLSLLAGTGREARIDGPVDRAAFAQPSGLARVGDALYVADSEISCVREVDLGSGWVRTVAGGDLFEFGDVDGIGDDVRMQHPIGICAREGWLLVADTFNHEIKALDPRTREVGRLYGNGERLDAAFLAFVGRPTLPETATGDAPMFFEPEGLWADSGRLFVADTNNHRIDVIDLQTGEASIWFGG